MKNSDQGSLLDFRARGGRIFEVHRRAKTSRRGGAMRGVGMRGKRRCDSLRGATDRTSGNDPRANRHAIHTLELLVATVSVLVSLISVNPGSAAAALKSEDAGLAPARSARPTEIARIPLTQRKSSNLDLDDAQAILMSDGSVAYEFTVTPPLDLGPLDLSLSASLETGEYTAQNTAPVAIGSIGGSAADPITTPDSVQGTYQSRAYLRTLDPAGYMDDTLYLAETRNLLRWFVDPYDRMSTVSFYWDGEAKHPTFLGTNWYRDYLAKSGPFYNPEPTNITLAVWANYWNQDWLTSAYTYNETRVTQTANLNGTSMITVYWRAYGESYLLLHYKLVQRYGL